VAGVVMASPSSGGDEEPLTSGLCWLRVSDSLRVETAAAAMSGAHARWLEMVVAWRLRRVGHVRLSGGGDAASSERIYDRDCWLSFRGGDPGPSSGSDVASCGRGRGFPESNWLRVETAAAATTPTSGAHAC